MVRVDLETGQVSVAHENVLADGRRFNLEHSNPHPVLPNLFLSGAHIIDLETGEWLDHCDDGVRARWHGQGYYHWALDGKRIYTKQLASPHVQCLSRIDLETGENRWFACPPHTGLSVHAHVAPNEQFVVGEGYDFDENHFPPDLRALLQQRLDEGVERRWSAFYLTGLPVLSGTVPPAPISNGAETIWKYVLPEESVLDDEKYWQDYDTDVSKLSSGPRGAGRRPAARARQDGHDHADLHVSNDDALAQGARPPARSQRQRHPGQPLGGVSVFERRRLLRGVGRTAVPD